MLENIQNVLNVPEFRKRAVFTLIMFVVFRLGVHIPVPGVDSSVIENLFSSGNLFGLLDLFAGGALSKFSILAMSITPYINASIIMQLLTAVVPTFEQWAKDNQEGRDKIQKVTRYGTVVLALIQAFAMRMEPWPRRSPMPRKSSISEIPVTISAFKRGRLATPRRTERCLRPIPRKAMQVMRPRMVARAADVKPMVIVFCKASRIPSFSKSSPYHCRVNPVQ